MKKILIKILFTAILFLVGIPSVLFSSEKLSKMQTSSETTGTDEALLIFHSSTGNLETVKKLLKKEKADVNVQDKNNENGLRPLHFAAFTGTPAMLRVLIEHKADVNLPDNNGCTPLMLAASQCSLEKVHMLLAEGASVDVTNNKGWGARTFAAEANCLRVFTLLNRGRILTYERD